MSQTTDTGLDDLAQDAAASAAFLEALEAAVPGLVPEALLGYLKAVATDAVGLPVLLAAIRAGQRNAQGQPRPGLAPRR